MLVCLGLLSACARTGVNVFGTPPASGLCRSESKALIVWRSSWRADQKDVTLREAAAQKGFERFAAESNCFAVAKIQRLENSLAAEPLDWTSLRELAVQQLTQPDLILLVTVQELGPVLRLFGPTFIEGGTEVRLMLHSFPLTGLQAPAEWTLHWQHGGPWYIQGVENLDSDLATAMNWAVEVVSDPFLPSSP